MVVQTTAYDEIANLMASGIAPERLIAYRIPVELLARYEYLVEKEKSGLATPAEKSELDSLLMINHIISLAKLRAMGRVNAVA